VDKYIVLDGYGRAINDFSYEAYRFMEMDFLNEKKRRDVMLLIYGRKGEGLIRGRTKKIEDEFFVWKLVMTARKLYQNGVHPE